MKTVFDSNTREQLVSRILSLSSASTALWGKMTVAQMARHCVLWEEMIHQNKAYKRVFISWLLGKIMLKNEMQDKPMRKNNPTLPELTITGTGIDLEQEKQKWMELILLYESYNVADGTFVHPFFGKMTKEQVGRLAYKHNDHHLRQFGC